MFEFYLKKKQKQIKRTICTEIPCNTGFNRMKTTKIKVLVEELRHFPSH